METFQEGLDLRHCCDVKSNFVGCRPCARTLNLLFSRDQAELQFPSCAVETLGSARKRIAAASPMWRWSLAVSGGKNGSCICISISLLSFMRCSRSGGSCNGSTRVNTLLDPLGIRVQFEFMLVLVWASSHPFWWLAA